MANTFSQIYIQIVFSVKNRECLLSNKHKEELHKYITGIVTKNKYKLIAVNSVQDHIHIFIGLNPSISLSGLIKDIKLGTSGLIKANKLVKDKFYWQDGYGAFSYSKSQVATLYKYIMNQEKHHKRKSFREEYLEFLKKFNVVYDERYVFDLE